MSTMTNSMTNRLTDPYAGQTVDKGLLDVFQILPQLIQATVSAASKSAAPSYPPPQTDKGFFDVISILPQLITATVQAASKSAPAPAPAAAPSDKGFFDVISILPQLIQATVSAASKGPVGAPVSAPAPAPSAPPVKGWDQILSTVGQLATLLAQAKSGGGDEKGWTDFVGGIVRALPTVIQIAGMVL